MTKPPKDPIRRYPSEGRVLETNRTNKPRTVERLPDPISAHGDAVVTIVGTNFGDRTSWGPAFRLVLVIPPTFVGPPRVEASPLAIVLPGSRVSQIALLSDLKSRARGGFTAWWPR